MPTYSYACRECDHRFDFQQAFHDDALTTCPQCGGSLRKIYSAVGVVFKGSGFYRNDSRAGSSSSATSGSGSSSSGDSGSSNGSGGSSSGSGDSGKSDSSGSSGGTKTSTPSGSGSSSSTGGPAATPAG